MLKRRDPIAIGSVGAYTDEESHELYLALTKLVKDISSVSESYKGQDAEIQVANFLATADKINKVIKNFNYYGNYMKNVASYDTDNLNTAKRNFNNYRKNPEVLKDEVSDLTLSNEIISNSNLGGDDNE